MMSISKLLFRFLSNNGRCCVFNVITLHETSSFSSSDIHLFIYSSNLYADEKSKEKNLNNGILLFICLFLLLWEGLFLYTSFVLQSYHVSGGLFINMFFWNLNLIEVRTRTSYSSVPRSLICWWKTWKKRTTENT